MVLKTARKKIPRYGNLTCFYIALTVVLIFRLVPFGIRWKIFFVIAEIFFAFSPRKRRRIYRNAALIRPDLTPQEIRNGYGRFLKTLSFTWALFVDEPHSNRITLQNTEKLLERYHAGEKIIITISHVGPVDALLDAADILGVKIYVPIQPIRPLWLLWLMQRIRMRKGNIILEPIEKYGITGIIRHLARARVTALAIDVTGPNGISCRIGKARAKFPTGAVRLALRQNAIIFSAVPTIGDDKKIELDFRQTFLLNKTGDKKIDAEINMRRLIEEVYAPYIQSNWSSWLQLPWANLDPEPHT